MLDDRTKAGGFGAQRGRVGSYRHLFADITDRQLEIEASFFAGDDANAVASDGLESGQHDLDAVLARRQPRDRVNALGCRHGEAGLVSGDIAHRNRSPRYRRAGLIDNGASDLGTGDLREHDRWRGDQQRENAERTNTRVCTQATHSAPPQWSLGRLYSALKGESNRLDSIRYHRLMRFPPCLREFRGPLAPDRHRLEPARQFARGLRAVRRILGQ